MHSGGGLRVLRVMRRRPLRHFDNFEKPGRRVFWAGPRARRLGQPVADPWPTRGRRTINLCRTDRPVHREVLLQLASRAQPFRFTGLLGLTVTWLLLRIQTLPAPVLNSVCDTSFCGTRNHLRILYDENSV